MSHPPSRQRLALLLVASVIGVQLIADVLPRIVVPVVILAGVFVIVRIAIFFTQRW